MLAEAALDPTLVELLHRRSEPNVARQAAQRPDEPELRGDDVDDEAEPRLPRKREAMLGLALHLGERIARREHDS